MLIASTSAFDKDLEKLTLDLANLPEWIEVMECLESGKPLPIARKDHKMKGKMKKYRDCHIKPDLVLIYERRKDCIILHRIGSHSYLKLMKRGKS